VINDSGIDMQTLIGSTSFVFATLNAFVTGFENTDGVVSTDALCNEVLMIDIEPSAVAEKLH